MSGSVAAPYLERGPPPAAVRAAPIGSSPRGPPPVAPSVRPQGRQSGHSRLTGAVSESVRPGWLSVRPQAPLTGTGPGSPRCCPLSRPSAALRGLCRQFPALFGHRRRAGRITWSRARGQHDGERPATTHGRPPTAATATDRPHRCFSRRPTDIWRPVLELHWEVREVVCLG